MSPFKVLNYLFFQQLGILTLPMKNHLLALDLGGALLIPNPLLSYLILHQLKFPLPVDLDQPWRNRSLLNHAFQKLSYLPKAMTST